MKKLLFLMILFSSCEKDSQIVQDPNNKSVYSGTFYAERNGVVWKAQPTANYNYSDKNFYNLNFDSLSSGYLQRSFSFNKLPVNHLDTIRNFGKHVPINLTPYISFDNIDVDVTYDTWEPLFEDSLNNWIKINKFDTISKEVEGTFSATMVRSRGVTFGFPDTMRFRNGRFSTKLWK
ncbi:MAG: hypothetical protein KBF75_13400 [Saprospiraceae bacterium]|nr:hypothetical protein [Saprospiraceae bacterium]